MVKVIFPKKVIGIDCGIKNNVYLCTGKGEYSKFVNKSKSLTSIFLWQEKYLFRF